MDLCDRESWRTIRRRRAAPDGNRHQRRTQFAPPTDSARQGSLAGALHDHPEVQDGSAWLGNRHRNGASHACRRNALPLGRDLDGTREWQRSPPASLARDIAAFVVLNLLVRSLPEHGSKRRRVGPPRLPQWAQKPLTPPTTTLLDALACKNPNDRVAHRQHPHGF